MMARQQLKREAGRTVKWCCLVQKGFCSLSPFPCLFATNATFSPLPPSHSTAQHSTAQHSTYTERHIKTQTQTYTHISPMVFMLPCHLSSKVDLIPYIGSQSQTPRTGGLWRSSNLIPLPRTGVFLPSKWMSIFSPLKASSNGTPTTLRGKLFYWLIGLTDRKLLCQEIVFTVGNDCHCYLWLPLPLQLIHYDLDILNHWDMQLSQPS